MIALAALLLIVLGIALANGAYPVTLEK